MIKRFSCIVVIISICGILPAREKINLDKGWEFAFGNASSPALDFGCGTEYFTYLTKAASIHNEGPYSQSFDKSKWPAQWKTVDLPQDASSQGTYTDDNYIPVGFALQYNSGFVAPVLPVLRYPQENGIPIRLLLDLQIEGNSFPSLDSNSLLVISFCFHIKLLCRKYRQKQGIQGVK